MIRKITAVIISTLFASFTVRAETLVTDLSQSEIQITSQFAGSQLLLFGALERHATESTQTDQLAVQGLDYDIIVVVQSEPTDLVIRKKEKIGGIWINNENETVRGVPGYYVIGSTRALDEFLSPQEQRSLGLGLKNIKVTNDNDMEVGEYKDALIRNMVSKRLYQEDYGNVTVKDEILFRATLDFPSNMPVGDYKADVYLVRDGEVVINHRTDLLVDKIGLERLIYNFAHEFPPLYGIMAILVAISAGLFSGFVARKVT